MMFGIIDFAYACGPLSLPQSQVQMDLHGKGCGRQRTGVALVAWTPSLDPCCCPQVLAMFAYRVVLTICGDCQIVLCVLGSTLTYNSFCLLPASLACDILAKHQPYVVIRARFRTGRTCGMRCTCSGDKEDERRKGRRHR